MSSITNELLDFIDTAERNRKYPTGTASGRRAALRMFEAELNEDEKESLDTLKKNLDQIYQTVFSKNKNNMNAESLETYRKRLRSLIEDYEKYGKDPTKLSGWNRPVKKVSQSIEKKKTTEQPINTQSSSEISSIEKNTDFSRFELPLRSGVKAIIIVPSDISKTEVLKLRGYIDFLDSISLSDNNEAENEKS